MENEPKKLEYDFMEEARENIKEFTSNVQVLDYWATVEMDLLNHIDSSNWSIKEAEYNLETKKSNDLLEFDFQEAYGKSNERIEKAHFQRVYAEEIKQINRLKHQRDVYKNQLKFVQEIMSNLRLILKLYGDVPNDCVCNCEE